jgi:hypothetical protein
MTNAEWLSPRKLREYYIDHVLPDVQEASKQLFLAAAGGEVRARCQGVIINLDGSARSITVTRSLCLRWCGTISRKCEAGDRSVIK